MLGIALEVDLKYPKRLRELHNDHLLATDKKQIKKEMLPSYQLKIADFYNIYTGNIKNWCPTFLIKKSIWFLMRT